MVKVKDYGGAVVLVVILIVVGYSFYMRTAPIRLSGVEVTEYRGARLSSAATDFRENSIRGPQQIDVESYSLKISGLVLKPREFSYGEVIRRQSYEKVVSLHCVEGWTVTILWEGVLVMDLIREAGYQPYANTVIFHAYDGYTTSLSLAYLADREILMAYRMNNVTLPAERGFPFQLVAEDKWGYKWIKWITEIELSDDPNYRGYWESRGYSNTGNLDDPFLE